MSRLATQIPEDVFEHIARNAGILLKTFDPQTWTVSRSAIIGATTGGISFADKPTYKDYGEDIDNCPKNTAELKEIEDREVTCSGTYVSITPDQAKELVGAASLSEKKITPTDELTADHFIPALWFVTDYGDGGAIAIKMENVLNTDGFALKTEDKGKGQFAFNYMAHYSLENPDKVPYEILFK